MSENNVDYGNSKPFKAIVTGDWHYRGTSPRSRLDDFQEALEAKLQEVLDLARKHGTDCIICPGDVFDGPSAAWGTVARLVRVLTSGAAPNDDCPTLTVSGNHDIFGGNKSSKPRTPYGFLVQTGHLWDVEESTFTTGAVRVTGCGFDTNTDTKTPEGKAQFEPQSQIANTFKIHVVHSMLMDQAPGFEGMRHTLISEVETGADVIIAGHYHDGFGIVRRKRGGDESGGEVLFINPGALCRLSAHVSEMERVVQVALLTVEAGADGARSVNAELIPLKSARPGHEVLSREHIEAAAKRESRIDEFLKLLASEGEGQFLEVREILEDIAAREALGRDVKDEALRRVSVAREMLGVGEGLEGAGVLGTNLSKEVQT